MRPLTDGTKMYFTHGRYMNYFGQRVDYDILFAKYLQTISFIFAQRPFYKVTLLLIDLLCELL